LALLILFCPSLLAQSTVEWKTNFYAVSGSSVGEIRRSIGQSRPWRDTTGVDASTMWRIKWDAKVASTEGQCGCTSFVTKVSITLTLPRWVGPTNAPIAVRQEWKRYFMALEKHEIDHAHFALSAVGEMHKRVPAVGAQPDCTGLTRNINQLARGILDDYRKREKDYDTRTMHGVKDGATLR
jgi:predicted secreted Zn-dependent protease